MKFCHSLVGGHSDFVAPPFLVSGWAIRSLLDCHCGEEGIRIGGVGPTSLLPLDFSAGAFPVESTCVSCVCSRLFSELTAIYTFLCLLPRFLGKFTQNLWKFVHLSTLDYPRGEFQKKKKIKKENVVSVFE